MKDNYVSTFKFELFIPKEDRGLFFNDNKESSLFEQYNKVWNWCSLVARYKEICLENVEVIKKGAVYVSKKGKESQIDKFVFSEESIKKADGFLSSHVKFLERLGLSFESFKNDIFPFIVKDDSFGYQTLFAYIVPAKRIPAFKDFVSFITYGCANKFASSYESYQSRYKTELKNNNVKAKPPTFKTKANGIYIINKSCFVVEDDKITILGKTWKFNLPKRDKGKIEKVLVVNITYDDLKDKFYIHLATDMNIMKYEGEEKTIGVDLNVHNLYTTSEGEVVDATRDLQKIKGIRNRVKNICKRLSKKRIRFGRKNHIKKITIERETKHGKVIKRSYPVSSNNARKLHKKQSLLRRKEANIRLNLIRASVSKTCENVTSIKMEDLNIKGMTASAKGGKKKGMNREFLYNAPAIVSATFERFLEKRGMKDKFIKVPYAYTSITCRCCGEKGSRKKEDTGIFDGFVCLNNVCEEYKKPIHSGINAAINILNKEESKKSVFRREKNDRKEKKRLASKEKRV